MFTAKHSTSDKTIRAVLIKQLKAEYKDHQDTAIISEFTLPYGSARVDIAVVNGVMHGFELKSDIDNLLRLSGQIDAYNLIFDKVTLVVGKTHILEALGLIPDWWGVTVAKNANEEFEPLLIPVRKATINPKQDIHTIANILWKDEALAVLEQIGKSKNMRDKQKKYICEKLVDSLSEQELKDQVRNQLIKRDVAFNLQAVSKLMPCGG